MAFALSSGPFQYNRFDVLNEKKADKDYDGDGKVESGKAEYFGSKDKAIKKATGKCGSDCDCKDCSTKKEEFRSDVQTLIDEGMDLSDYTWDGLYEEYITEGLPPELLQAIMKKKMGKGKGKKEVKESITKEDVIAYLVENNYVNNEVSAEVIFNHITDEFLEEIEGSIMEAYQQMSPKATEMSKRRSGNLSDQEYKAAGTGDEKKTNKLMQQKIAVMDARSRHGARPNK